jgi:hypothetical protein
MDQDAIIQYISDTCTGVDIVRPTDGPGAGDTFFIYDPERTFDDRHRFPFATIVTKDYGEFDCLSKLDRPGVFRLNIGVNREAFHSLFGAQPEARDYGVLDQLLPHPVYAPQSWVSVLNPSTETFELVKPLLAQAYDMAVRRAQPRA